MTRDEFMARAAVCAGVLYTDREALMRHEKRLQAALREVEEERLLVNEYTEKIKEGERRLTEMTRIRTFA
jgi:hypothetical protein